MNENPAGIDPAANQPDDDLTDSTAPPSIAPPSTAGHGTAGHGSQRQIVVVGPDGQPMAVAPIPAGDGDGDGDGDDDGSGIGEPAKVMRIGTMIKQLLEEVRAAPLDEASRLRLKEIHARSIRELESGLAPELREELERLSLPFTNDSVPSEGELRIAQAQLVGWLEGVFHGLQTALFAQQMAARVQLEQMRRGQLPPGESGPASGTAVSTGQYL